jgi:hypothetical protein
MSIYDDYFEFEEKELKTKLDAIIGEDGDSQEEKDDSWQNCTHSETSFVDSNEICSLCGIIVNKNLSSEQDLSYDGLCDVKNKDPTRSHKRKTGDRTLFKDVDGKNFPDVIIQSANNKYQQIINKNIYRGAKRKAIIVACLHFAYLEKGESRITTELGKLFGIQRRDIKDGLQKYYETFPDETNKYIKPINLIPQIMIKSHIPYEYQNKIKKLCSYLENKSELLNRSTPQSVAASIVYLYLCLNTSKDNLDKSKSAPSGAISLLEKLGLDKFKFAEMVNLSDITITKLGKESQKIIATCNQEKYKDIKI